MDDIRIGDTIEALVSTGTGRVHMRLVVTAICASWGATTEAHWWLANDESGKEHRVTALDDPRKVQR